MKPFLKDPDAVLDFGYDWKTKNWLGDSETITSHTIIPDAGITVDNSSESNGIVTVWLSGGTAGIDYIVTCRIVTSEGRTDDRSLLIRCGER